jgi:hypothetical protein
MILTLNKRIAAAATALIICTALPAFAGPKSTVNGTVAGTTSTASSSSIMAAISTITIPTSGIVIDGKPATVTQDANGSVLVNGQPLVVNGIPNIGLLMSLSYAG